MIQKQTIEYKHAATTMKGHLAFEDSAAGKRPGILVCHEWWGLNDYIRGRAEQLASLGYVAFALDMYGNGQTASNPAEAGKLMNALMSNPEAMFRVHAAVDVLRSNAKVDSRKLAAIGYCMGGSMALHMARAGLDLASVVSFHGALKAEKPATSRIKAKVLICHGADDPMVTMDQVRNFDQEMRKAGADYQIIIYGGAQHAFTNPNADKAGVKGLKYNPSADHRSWEAMKTFFAEIFA
jgi:dienelactone hydrolase